MKSADELWAELAGDDWDESEDADAGEIIGERGAPPGA